MQEKKMILRKTYTRYVTAMFLIGAAVSTAQAAPRDQGLSITVPNGYANVSVDDLQVQSVGGTVRWMRVWNGQEWKFNPQWESLSQSWKNLTGSQTEDTTGATVSTTGNSAQFLSAQSSGGSSSSCWVWVDEDWTPSPVGEVVVVGGIVQMGPMLPERMAPFNRIMGDTESDYIPPRVVSVDYANLCMGGYASNASSIDLEAIRKVNELYLGESGRYAFSNRAILEKRSVSQLPQVANAALLSGRISLAPVVNTKGYRWIDREGVWIDYNTQGQIVAWGDRNNNITWLARNSQGKVQGVIDAGGRVIYSLHYNEAGLVAEVRDYPSGAQDLPARVVKYEYDDKNRLVKVVDALGFATQYSYNAGNQLVGVKNAEGREEVLAYNGNTVKQRVAPDGGITDYVFEYDDVNKQFVSKITGPETPAGRKVEDFTHNRVGQLVRRIVNGKTMEEVRHDTGARTTISTDARGFAVRTVRNEFDQIVEMERRDGSIVKRSYSPLNLQMVEEIDGAGIKTQYQYDAKGNLLKRIEALGLAEQRTTEYELNAMGQVLSLIRKGQVKSDGTSDADARWRFEYDELGQVKATTDPMGIVKTYVYDRMGKVRKITDGRGNATIYQVDAQGDLLAINAPLGRNVSISYDKVGNPSQYTDERGKVWGAIYDSMNRLLSATTPEGGQASRQYNAEGGVVKQTDEDGRGIAFAYDNFLRKIKEIDGQGNSIDYSYAYDDEDGIGISNVPTKIDFPTFSERTRSDEMDRPTSSVFRYLSGQASRSATTAKTYDKLGRIKEEIDAQGKSVSYSYNGVGQLEYSIDRLGFKTSFKYDSRGNLTQVVNAKNARYEYEYDLNDRLVTAKLPLGHTTLYAYDAAGNMVERQVVNGPKVAHSYDAANRLKETKKYNLNGALESTVSYEWDLADHLINWADAPAIGGRASSGVIIYDDAGRKIHEAVNYLTPQGGSFNMGYGYAYSLAGKKRALTWPDGTNIQYEYSAHGELKKIKIPNEGDVDVLSYDWLNPANVAWPGGALDEMAYDGLQNLLKLKSKNPAQQTVLEFGATYGVRGEMLSSFRGNGGSVRAEEYIYDDDLRLTSVTAGIADGSNAATQTFLMDAVSNRIASGVVAGDWIYDENNRLKSIGAGSAAVVFAYDAPGNVIEKIDQSGGLNFQYDAENRLTSVMTNDGDLIARYGYDPLGRRLWKEQFREKSGGLLPQPKGTYYLYADEGLVAEAEYSLSGGAGAVLPKITKQYGFVPSDEFGAKVVFVRAYDSYDNVVVAYYRHNHLDAPLQAFDKQGNVVWAGAYDAYGSMEVTTPVADAVGVIESNVRLPGQYFDIETGLHYNYQRYYAPELGRYIQSDPLGLIGGINSYAYADANPMSYVDPLGLWASQKGAYVHQRAGYLAFGGQITQQQLSIIAHGHEWADGPAHQTSQYTFMHAMRRPGQSVAEACAEANRFIKDLGSRAVDANRHGRTNEALFMFSVVLHTLQDSTSPSHGGFQEWSGHEGAIEVGKHIAKEVLYPGRGSSLDNITKRAWDAFQRGNVSDMALDCSCP